MEKQGVSIASEFFFTRNRVIGILFFMCCVPFRLRFITYTHFFSVIIIIWNCNSIFVFYSVRFSKWMFNETKITQLSADKHLHSYVWFRISSCELLFICLWFFRLMSVSSFLVVVAAFVFFVILFISWRAREINFSRRLCEWLKFKQKQWFFKINEKKAKSFE